MTIPPDAALEEDRLRQELEEWGVLEPEQPTVWSHREYVQRMEQEFTSQERRMIRYLLGLSR